MPSIEANGMTLHYRFDGPPEAPVVMLSNSLASDLVMWKAQVSAFTDAGYRVLRYDSRGHGRSTVPEGPYTMALLTEDAVALMDVLDLDRVIFLGCSKGGMVGQMLATQHGSRLKSLILCATAAHVARPDVWNERIDTVRKKGMGAVADATIDRWFTKAGQKRLPEQVASIRRMVVETPVEGYCSCSVAIRDMDQRESIRAISTPTLIVVGEHDPGTPVSAAELLHERIEGSELIVLPDSAHFAHVEQADAFNGACLSFLRD